MKIHDAMKIMERGIREPGFAVHFAWAENGRLRSDFFPDVRAGETPIPTEQEAWKLAEQFASKTAGQCVNIYVIRAEDFTPVPDYKLREMPNRRELRCARPGCTLPRTPPGNYCSREHRLGG